MRPSTTTVSTLCGCALRTMAVTGSPSGAMLRSVVRTRIRSARLPGVSEPVRSATPKSQAPLIVAISRTWRAVTLSGSFERTNCVSIIRRIAVNMSVVPATGGVSMARLTLRPSFNSSRNCGSA